MQYKHIATLLGIQGFKVVGIEQAKHKGHSAVIIDLERIQSGYRCNGCGERVKDGYDSKEQIFQHLTWWHHITLLRFRRYRADCSRCGARTELLDFVDVRGPRVTKLLSALVFELCKVMTIKAVGVFQVLNRHTVKAIDKAALQREQAQRPLDGITVLGADEIAVGKGHNYWTLFSALEGPRGPELLNIVEGRSERKLKKFWRWFGKERAAKITHAVIDMCQAFENSIRAHCCKKVDGTIRVAQIIYDKFHVVRHLNEALNTVRKAELNKALGRFKKTLSGKKFVLLARRARVRGKAREALNAILGASPRLYKAHLLKESFGHLWDYHYKGCMLRFWEDWKSQLKWSRLKPYRSFVQMVEEHLDGILSYCDKKVSLGYIESSNLKARNVIRRAYGYRDKEYMKLKIIQDCTPWMIQFQPWRFTHSLPP